MQDGHIFVHTEEKAGTAASEHLTVTINLRNQHYEGMPRSSTSYSALLSCRVADSWRS